MPESLANQFRPKTLSEVVGQPKAVSIIDAWQRDNDMPHVVLLVGDSGTGKTTLSGLLTKLVGCDPKRDEHIEINSADDRSIDMARELTTRMAYKPLPPSKVKVAEIDEVVQLPEATQQAMLDALENPPPWAYYFLCTSRVNKLLNTFRSRCKVLKLESLSSGCIYNRLVEVVKPFVNDVYDSVLHKIADLASGNMREAFSMLETVYLLDTREAQLRALESWVETREDDPTGNLCRALLAGNGIMDALKSVTDSPEGVRMRVLAYMNKVLRSGNDRAARVIDTFQYDFSQFGNQSQAGLALYCWKCQLQPMRRM